MFRRAASLGLFLALSWSSTAAAQPTIIDFEDLAAGPFGAPPAVTVTNQYVARGVSFNGPTALDYAALPGFAHSGSKAVEACYGVEFCTLPIEATFVSPQAFVRLWVGFSGISVGAPQTRTVLLTAFGPAGQELARAVTTLVIGPEPVPIRVPLEVRSAGSDIVRAQVNVVGPGGAPASTSSLAVDDVEFDSEIPARPVEATLGPPGPGNPSGTAAEPVNTATGNYYLQSMDLGSTGRGPGLVLVRTYNSQDLSSGPLGRGWRHSLDVSLREESTGLVVIRQGDGQAEFFEPIGGGAYRPRFPGTFNVLTRTPAGTFTLTSREQIRQEFEASGRLVRLVDRNGNALRLDYRADGTLDSATDATGRRLLFQHDGSGRITRVTDPIGRRVRFAYDSAGNLVSATDPGGATVRYVYDGAGRLVQLIDGLGNTVVQNVYDARARVASQTNGLGAVTAFAYDSPGPGGTTITDPRGNRTVHTHDSQLRLLAVTDALGGRIAIEYDADDNRIVVTDQNGNALRMRYDARGNLVAQVDARGNTTSFTYDALNNLLSLVDPRGARTSFEYDARGNPRRTIDPLGNVTSYTTDDFGQVVEIVDALGNRTRFTYNRHGRLDEISDATGGTTRHSYDDLGRLVAFSTPRGSRSTVQYDANSRLAVMTDPLDHATRLQYDAAGNLTEILDARGKSTRFRYDAIYNLLSATDARGAVTRYAYDAASNRVALTDANGHRRDYEYDPLNRLSAITDALGGVTRYGYDPAGNVISLLDPNGRSNRYQYDPDDQLTRILYGDGLSVAYGYDTNGNRTSMVDSLGLTRYGYDLLDRLVEVTDPRGRLVRYEYNAGGLLSRLAQPSAEVRFDYDALNRLARVRAGQDRRTTFSYDAASNLRRVDYPNGTRASYDYDAADRVTKIKHERLPGGRSGQAATDNTELLAELVYTLDQLGNRTRVREKLAGRPDRTINNKYDALSQLLEEQVKLSERTSTTKYTYDPVGNLLSEAIKRSGGGDDSNRTFSYDAGDRLIRAGELTFGHDRNGNRTSKVGRSGANPVEYSWDAANRLREVSSSSSRVSFEYDGDGNKVRETMRPRPGGPVETVDYLNDVSGPLPVVLQSDFERDGNPVKQVRFHYGPSRIQQEIVRDGGVTDDFFFHTDRLGSTVLLTDNAGRRSASYRYDAWGNLDDRTGDVPNRFLFTGEEQQPETELYYLRARWYDPSVSRFLSRDPLQGVDVAPRRGIFAGVPIPFGGVPGVPAALNGTAVPPGNANAYLYVSNNPVNFVDPSGAFSIKGAFKSAWNGVKSAATSPVGRFVIKVAVGTVIQAGVTAAFGGTPLGIVVGGFLAGVTTSLIDRALAGESFSLSRVILQDVVVGGGLGAVTAWAPLLPGAPTKYIPYDPIDVLMGRAAAALLTPFAKQAVDPDWSPGLEVRSSPLSGGLPGIPPVVGGVRK